MRFLFCFFTCFILFAATPIVKGQELGISSNPDSSSIEDEAKRLFEQGRFEEIIAILRPLVEVGGPIETSILFLFGLAAAEAAQRLDPSDPVRSTLLDESIFAFRTILFNQPSLVRVRLELARAFFLKGSDGLAKKHFEQVLAGNPPQPVVININRFLIAMQNRKKWSGSFHISLAQDSNIGSESDSRIIYIADLPFERDVEELTTSGTGISLWAGGDYYHPISDRHRLRSGGSISIQEYTGKRFDKMTLSGHVGPHRQVNPNLNLGFLVSGRQYRIGDSSVYRDIGFRVETVRRHENTATTRWGMSWHNRRYFVQTDLNGIITDLHFGISKALNPTTVGNATIGYGREKPKAERWRVKRYWIRLGASFDLDRGITISTNAKYERANYSGSWFPNTPVGVSRQDITRSLRLSGYNRKFTIRGYSPQVSVVRENRSTNAQLYEFDRTFGEMTFIKQF